jgi:hypothetical protein
MKFVAFFWGLFLLIWMSCGTTDSHDGVLSEAKFEDMIYEMHMTDAILMNRGLRDDLLQTIDSSYYNYVFKKMDVSPKEFSTSVNYYTEHPKQFQRVYANVLTRITAINDSIEKATRIQDSLEFAKRAPQK